MAVEISHRTRAAMIGDQGQTLPHPLVRRIPDRVVLAEGFAALYSPSPIQTKIVIICYVF